MGLRHVGKPIIGLTYAPEDVVPVSPEATLVLRSGNIQGGSLALDDVVYVICSIPAHLRLRRGDILICSRNGSRNLIGKNLSIPQEVEGQSFGAFMTVFRSQFNPFLYWVFNSRLFEFQTATFLSSTINQLTTGNLKGMKVPFPPRSEQQAIAKFLEVETAKIDSLIGKQQQLIATLREDRHAQLINLVAHGCDSATTLKPCKLGWVESVPRRWDVVNIRRVATMKTGHTPSRTVVDYWENTTIPWFTLADVWQLRDGLTTYLGETKGLISELGLANSAAELLPAGTVVLSRTASVGFTGIMPGPMATSQDFWNWVCGPRILPEYLMYTFRAMQGYFSALMMGSTHQTIYQADAAAIRIPLPPLSEQRQIVQQIVSKTGAIDELTAKAVQMIGALREYRSALITDAVTGKIDVRGAA